MVRGDAVDRLAEFGAVLGIFEDFGPSISEPQVVSRTFEQANTELALKVGNAAADGRGRHLEAARRFRKAVRLDNLGENHQRIEVRHRYFSCSFRSPLRRDRRTGRGGTHAKVQYRSRAEWTREHIALPRRHQAGHISRNSMRTGCTSHTRIGACSRDYPKVGK